MKEWRRPTKNGKKIKRNNKWTNNGKLKYTRMESDLKQMLTKKNVLGKQNFLMNECVVRERERATRKRKRPIKHAQKLRQTYWINTRNEEQTQSAKTTAAKWAARVREHKHEKRRNERTAARAPPRGTTGREREKRKRKRSRENEFGFPFREKEIDKQREI